MFIKFMFLLLNYMLGVGYFMFIERKFLGFAHYREGPNKVLLKGYLQFIFDMIKLVVKDFTEINKMMMVTYFLIPMILFLNLIVMWIILPFYSNILNVEISIIYLILIMLIKMFYFMVMIFFIYSPYSFMSMIRMVIQIISYDIVIILVFLLSFIVYLNFTFDMFVLNMMSTIVFFNFFVFFFWVISIMCELIRLPFDFYEGESELISGFNIEYSSILFLILVLIEYMEMIYFIILTVLLFMCFFFFNFVFICLMLFFVFFLIWLRVFFIRYRLDKMLIMLWKFIFPIMMFYIFFYYYLTLV